MPNSQGEFSWHFPIIGKVNIKLSNRPLEFYEFLKEKKEIERLKKLKHLGILEVLFPGVKHSRYDYTFLTLNMVEKLNLSGISSEKKILDVKLSGRDFLQLLVLASNIGHVPGTFAIEKGILEYILEKKLVKKSLITLKNLSFDNGKEIDKIEKWIKETQDYTLFNKVLALLKIANWITEDPENNEVNLFLRIVAQILIGLFLPSQRQEYQQKLYGYYDVLRRLSYLFLDASYLPMPIHINFQELFKYTESFEKIVNMKTRNFFFQYEKIIYDNLYHSPKSRILTALVQKEILDFLDKSPDSVETILKETTQYEISPEFMNLSKNISNYKPLFSLQLEDIEGQFIIDEFLHNGLISTETDIFKRIGNKHLISNLLYLPGVGWDVPGSLWIDLLSSGGQINEVRDLVKLFLFFYHLDIDFFVDKVYESIFKCIMIKSLRKDELQIELSLHPVEFFGNEYRGIFCVANLRTKKDEVKSEIKARFLVKEEPAWPKQKKEKFHEHEALWELIKKLRKRLYKGKTRLRNRLFLILPASILVINSKTGEKITEFDGGVLEMRTKSGKAIFYVLEAKRGRKVEAQDELKRKFTDKLQIAAPKIEKLSKRDALAIWELN